MEAFDYDLDVKRKEQFRKLVYIVVGIALLFLFVIVAVTSAFPVYGIANNNTIRWNWSIDGNVSFITIDGVVIENYDIQETYYQQTFDKDNNPTIHTIRVYSEEGTNGINETLTQINIDTSIPDIADIIKDYIWLILGLIVLIVSIWGEIEYLPIGSIFFCFIGYAFSVNHSFEMGLIYLFAMIGAGIVLFKD